MVRERRCTLVVVVEDLEHAAGQCLYVEHLIFLDRTAIATATAAQLDYVFAHEVAHWLDPRPRAVTTDDREAFADDLGARLLRSRPTTLAAARPLIDAADRARPGHLEADDLPRGDVAAMVALRSLWPRPTATEGSTAA